MKKQSFTVLLILVSASSFAQVVREEERGLLIVTPLLAHNLSERVISSEVGLSIGVEAISNQSSLSFGYVYRRYFDTSNPSFHAVRLSSAVYPFANFGLGVSAHSDLRRGKFTNKQGTNLAVRNKVFGTIGLVYKIDANFRVETVVMVKDYTPNRWFDEVSTNPYGRSPLKVAMSYTIPVIKL